MINMFLGILIGVIFRPLIVKLYLKIENKIFNED